MYVGIPNPNILMPLDKLKITPENGKPIEVLYNPAQYIQSRTLETLKSRGVGEQEDYVVTGAGVETLAFKIFFDTMSAGGEVGGSAIDKLKFAENSILTSGKKQLDVRTYTDNIYKLMEVSDNTHHPPLLKLEWNSLKFVGILVKCKQSFVKFNKKGMPVRAWLDCVFMEAESPTEKRLKNPLNSPDTTKFRTVTQGDSLWAMAAAEYGQPELWRHIADANGLVNPRELRSGDRLAVPAIVD